MQKECEMEGKKGVRKRKEEESVSDAVEDGMHECEFFSMYERFSEEN
jgi:hypothetical protein